MKIVFLEAGHWHLPCYLKPVIALGHEAILFDRDVARVQAIAEKAGVDYRANYAELAGLNADFAFTFGSHDVMPEYIQMCIDHHIPFMAEKPGALKADTLAKLAERCDSEELFNAGPFSLRLDGAPAKIKEILDSGRLGRIARLGLTYFAGPAHRYHNWKCSWVLDKQKAGGGWLYNLGVHLVDLLYFWGFETGFLAGAMSSALNQGEIDDVSSMMVKTGADSYAVLEGGYCAKSMHDGYSFSIIGEKGNIEFSYGNLTVTGPDDNLEQFELPMRDSRGKLVEILLGKCRQGEKPPADLHDMVRALKVVDDFYGAMEYPRRA